VRTGPGLRGQSTLMGTHAGVANSQMFHRTCSRKRRQAGVSAVDPRGRQSATWAPVALLDAQKDLLVLLGRATAQAGADQITAGAKTVRARLSPTPSRDLDPWTAWGQWLSDIVLAAAGRAEYVVVETGGWDSVNEPYVLLGVFPDEAGAWLSRVEAAPPPADPPWTAPADGGTASSLLAPATRENVNVVGLLAIQAIPLWAGTPLEVILTFGRHPNGPWVPGDSEPRATVP
jgi:hypothetical protein